MTLESPEGQGVQGVPLICADSPCASSQDLDGYLYKSDASGAPQGDTLTNGDAEEGEPDCVTSFASESCKLKVQSQPQPQPQQPPAQSEPQAEKKKKKASAKKRRAACTKKAKKIKNKGKRKKALKRCKKIR